MEVPDDLVPEVVHKTPLELPISTFEGETVRFMVGKIPALTLAMDYGYPRNTHLKVELELRVQNLNHPEIRSGKHQGELQREHTFVVEQATVIGAYTAEELDPGVGGSASAQGNDLDPENPEGDGNERNDVGF